MLTVALRRAAEWRGGRDRARRRRGSPFCRMGARCPPPPRIGRLRHPSVDAGGQVGGRTGGVHAAAGTVAEVECKTRAEATWTADRLAGGRMRQKRRLYVKGAGGYRGLPDGKAFLRCVEAMVAEE